MSIIESIDRCTHSIYALLETISKLEKLIASRRITVPASRNQETASDMSDHNESNSKPKATLNFEINPAVNQQLEQLRNKLAVSFLKESSFLN